MHSQIAHPILSRRERVIHAVSVTACARSPKFAACRPAKLTARRSSAGTPHRAPRRSARGHGSPAYVPSAILTQDEFAPLSANPAGAASSAPPPAVLASTRANFRSKFHAFHPAKGAHVPTAPPAPDRSLTPPMHTAPQRAPLPHLLPCTGTAACHRHLPASN
jgi:hypothetical protein